MPTAADARARCPPPLEFAERKAELQDAIRSARNASAGRLLNRELAALRRVAPDRRAQALLDETLAAIDAGRLQAAEDAVSGLLRYCPDYAAAWHARAHLNLRRGDGAAALADLERVLALAPDHAVAMGERAVLLWYFGRYGEAGATLATALGLNPWLPQRELAKRMPGLAA